MLNFVIKKGDSELKNLELDRLVQLCFLSACSFFALACFLLYSAGKINSEYGYHKHIIKTNVAFYKDLSSYTNFYFKEVEENQVETHVNLFDGNSSTYLHEKFAREITNRVGKDHPDFLEEVLNTLNDLYDVSLEVVRELLDDEEFNCFKILGFKIDSSTVVQFVIFFVSIAITLYEILG